MSGDDPVQRAGSIQRDDPTQPTAVEADDFSVTSLAASPQRPARGPQRAGHSSRADGGLNRVGRLRRAGVAVGVVLLALLVLLGPALSLALSGAFAPARDRAQAALDPHPRAVATFPASGSKITIPSGSAGVGALSVSPAAGAPGTAYACWPTRISVQPTSGALHLAYTTDGGLTWRSLAPPTMSGAASGCLVRPDALSPDGLLLAVDDDAASVPCALPALYALRLGGAWRPVPLPTGALPACGFQVALAASAVYLWADTPLMPDTADSRGLFVWSPDLGASWRTSPAGLGNYSAFALLGVHARGQLLAQATHAAPAHGDALLESLDGGDSWVERGALPGTHPVVAALAPTSASSGDGWGALYATSAEVVSQPGDVIQYQLWATTSPTGPWAKLPAVPSPQPGTGSGGQDGEPLTLGAGPRGGLLIALPVPDTTQSRNTPQRELWLWDPARRAWLLGAELLPFDAFFDGLEWRGDTPTLWLTLIHLGVPPTVDLYTVALD